MYLFPWEKNKSKWTTTKRATLQVTAPTRFFLFRRLEFLSLERQWVTAERLKSQISFPNKVATLAWNLTGAITPLLSPNKLPFQRLWAMDTWVCVLAPQLQRVNDANKCGPQRRRRLQSAADQHAVCAVWVRTPHYTSRQVFFLISEKNAATSWSGQRKNWALKQNLESVWAKSRAIIL